MYSKIFHITKRARIIVQLEENYFSRIKGGYPALFYIMYGAESLANTNYSRLFPSLFNSDSFRVMIVRK